MATLLHPGRLSPTRQVPPNIRRPEYVGKKRPTLGEPDVKDAETIARMRVACRIAAQALEEVGRQVQPGFTPEAVPGWTFRGWMGMILRYETKEQP